MLEASPFKLALIVDGMNVSRYVYELAEWCKKQSSIELSLIVQQVPGNPTRTPIWSRAWKRLRQEGFASWMARIVWAMIYRLERLKLKTTRNADHFEIKNLSSVTPDILYVVPEISLSGWSYRYSILDIERMRKRGFHLLIRCGSGILRGDVLSVAEFGVLSFHHGDNTTNRGGPPGFWEVYERRAKTGFVIQQLTEELDGGNVLLRGSFPTQRYWLLNQARLYQRSNGYMKKLLEQIIATRALPKIHPQKPYYQPLYRRPSLSIGLHYFMRFIFSKGQHFWLHGLLRRRQRWGVAYAFTDWKNLVMWKAQRIENPPGRFLADPFVIMREGKYYCFMEDYDQRRERGCISVYRLDKNAIFLGHALLEEFHLSFPYLFEHEGTLYMVPESAHNRDIRIYECVSFPLQWRLKRLIMEDISAADSMIFRHGEYWWLLTNIDPSDGGDHCSELFAFYSHDPIHGEWFAHAGNPLIIDPTSARNGGLVRDETDLYRVAQHHGFALYGESASVRKITSLTPTEFSEEIYATIEPNFFKRLLATHHLHGNGSVTAFDFMENSRF